MTFVHREFVATLPSEEQEKALFSLLSSKYTPLLSSAHAKACQILGVPTEEVPSPNNLGEIFSDHGKRFYYYVKFGSGLEIGTISEEEISTQHQAFAQSVVDQLGQDAQRRPIQSANRAF